MNNNKHSFDPALPFAEVLTSTLDRYTAQSWQWNHMPVFGSLVQVTSNNITIIGCINQVKTGSLDPIRTPIAYQKTEDELHRDQPQIFAFLSTSFDVQVLGFTHQQPNEHATYHYMLPPQPPKIHTFVQQCSPEVSASFLHNPDFLHVLFAFQHQLLNLDELLLALIQRQTESSSINQEAFNEFCKTYSLLNGNDYRRLKLFLKRVESIIP